jgi:mercuric ion transport protein
LSNEKTSKALMGAGLLSAIAASLCCITPVLALIAGASGAASAFSWIEPARPYLIGVTVLVLGFAWYQKLKPLPTDDCGCAIEEKPKFLQTKSFLAIITVFAILMLAFPYYSKIFFYNNAKQVIVINQSDIKTAEFKISGMTCEGCTEEVKHEVNKLNGIIKADASYENTSAEVQFDKSKTNVEEITKAINSTGYTVTQSKIKQQ